MHSLWVYYTPADKPSALARHSITHGHENTSCSANDVVVNCHTLIHLNGPRIYYSANYEFWFILILIFMLSNKFNLILSINSKITQLILYVQSVYLKANKFCYQNLSLPSSAPRVM